MCVCAGNEGTVEVEGGEKLEWWLGHPVSAAWGVGGENLGVEKNKIVMKRYIQILL